MRRVLVAALLLVVRASAQAQPLVCAASAVNNIPQFHLINNVRLVDGIVATATGLNDANAVFVFGGLFHSMCQMGGGSWSHFVSADAAHWWQQADALRPGAHNSSWDNEGPCDGTLSFPGGRPTIMYGADCAEKSSVVAAGLGDFPRVGVAFGDASDPYLVHWAKDSANATFPGSLPCSFPGKVWRSSVGAYWNMLCALDGGRPWARYTSTDATLDTWVLANPSFAQPPGVVFDACAGDMFNSIPNPSPGGPTHMLQGCCGQCFFLGDYDARLEQFNVSSDKQWVDIGGGGLPFNPAAHWSATSNYFAEDARVLWIAWVTGNGAHTSAGKLGLDTLSLPRELVFDAAVAQLVSRPLAELAGLRNATLVDSVDVPLPAGARVALALPPGAGGAVDVLASFALPASGGAAARFGLAVRAAPDSPTDAPGQFVLFDVSAPDASGARAVTVDSLMGYRFDASGRALCARTCPSNTTRLLAGETLDVRVVVDKTVVETFVLGGRLAWTHPDEHGVFYNASRTSVWLVNYGDADVAAQNVSVWGMGCGWAGALPAPRRATRRG